MKKIVQLSRQFGKTKSTYRWLRNNLINFPKVFYRYADNMGMDKIYTGQLITCRITGQSFRIASIQGSWCEIVGANSRVFMPTSKVRKSFR